MNPARELEKIFTRWNKSVGLGSTTRSSGYVKIPANQIVDAINKIAEIDKIITYSANSLIPDGMYDEDLVEWANAATMAMHGMDQGPFIQRQHIRDIQKLAVQLDIMFGGVSVQRDLIKQNEQSLRDQLRVLADDIQNDSTLDGAFISHAVALIDQVHRCLDDLEGSGFFDLGEALRMLMIYIDASQTRTDDEEKRDAYSKFNDFLKHPFVNTVSGALFGGAGSLLQLSQ